MMNESTLWLALVGLGFMIQSAMVAIGYGLHIVLWCALHGLGSPLLATALIGRLYLRRSRMMMVHRCGQWFINTDSDEFTFKDLLHPAASTLDCWVPPKMWRNFYPFPQWAWA